MTITTSRSVKLNPVWPKYWMICGEVRRILTERDAPERLIGSHWHPDRG